MKKLIALVSVVFAITNMSAQLKVHSNGNVSIKTTETPNATLAIGGVGLPTQSFYVKSKNVPLRVERDGAATTSGAWSYGVDATNLATDTRMIIGVNSVAWTHDYTTINKGRAFGVYGAAGYTTSGYNYGIYGNLLSTQNGAAIVGAVNSMDVNVPGRYAGYFQGDVRTVLTPSASRSALMGRSAVMPLSAESDATNSMSVGEKLSRLAAVQYNLSEPQAAQTFAASGDTVAAAPRSVTDIQALEKTHYGLDAEVLKEVYPDLVYESQEGDLCINYTEMIPLLVQSVNELRAQVVSLQGTQTYNVRARNGSETGVGGNVLDVPTLEQNDPNPFTQTTVVRYTLPESVKSAFLYIYDLNGTQIDQKMLQSRGKSSVTLEAGSLAPGMYLYALVADGKVIDTKRMIIIQ